NLPCLLFRVAEIVMRDVATQNDQLIAQVLLDVRTIPAAHRVEGGGGEDVVPETLLGIVAGARPNHQVNARDFGESLEEHAERDLPQKAGSADKKDATAFKNFRGRKLHGNSLTRNPPGLKSSRIGQDPNFTPRKRAP